MILLLGFPKSGTTSFHTLFKNLGMISHHWIYNNKLSMPTLFPDPKCGRWPPNGMFHIASYIKTCQQRNIPLLSFVSEKDYEMTALTDINNCILRELEYWPQLMYYEQLYNENPNALFILNKRDPQRLLHSVKKWNQLDKRMLQYSPYLFQDFPSSFTDDEKLLCLFQTHYERVIRFFAERPEAKFVVYDIENDTIDKLAPYIDLKDVTVFPRENVNDGTRVCRTNHF